MVAGPVSIVIDNVFDTSPVRGAAAPADPPGRPYDRAVDFTPRVKMADVARTAGVSVATVSKVVNNRYGVARSTVERVQEVIDELGYQASLGAQSLRSRRTNVLGILVAEFEPFSTELLKGASAAVTDTGYELLAYSGGGGRARVGWEQRSLSRLSGALIDGAVLVTPTAVETQPDMPVVAVDPHTGPSGIPTVVSDNLTGAATAVRHLLGLGHRRIGFLGGRAGLESSRLREAGFRQAMAEAGAPVDESLVLLGGYLHDTALGPARELLDRADPPTAIFAANDLSALAVLDVAHERGLDVPGDLSVIGFDNVPESALASPSLTTISQPLREMGATALRLLVAMLDGEEVPDRVQLPTALVERASCAAPRSASPATPGRRGPAEV